MASFRAALKTLFIGASCIGNVAAAPTPDIAATSASSFRYLNSKTQPYQVTSLPDFNFDLGEFYSGSVPINTNDSSRSLFFAFKPAINAPSNTVTIWLTGGPGCSSLASFLEETGPWEWYPGQDRPTYNPYTWANLTNMLWVDQPVGTGFDTGKPTATTEEQIANDFVNFFKNWETLFGIQNYQIFVTGESYGGRYVPYVSAAMLNKNDKQYFNLSGSIIYDPEIGNYPVQQSAGAFPLAQSLQNTLGFNQSTLNTLAQLDQSCGWADLRNKYLTFPPPGPQPVNPGNSSDACNMYYNVGNAAYYNNPCFSVYEVNQQCPGLTDQLGPGSSVTPNQAYFNRTDVKKAMHAPAGIDWSLCGGYGTVLANDTSLPPIQKVLPQVIDATQRVLISNGDFDLILPTQGTLLAIQNMTWGGKLGLQQQPSQSIILKKSFADDTLPVQAGIQRYERGLMWARTFQGGHQQPLYQPAVAYRHLQWMLRLTDTL